MGGTMQVTASGSRFCNCLAIIGADGIYIKLPLAQTVTAGGCVHTVTASGRWQRRVENDQVYAHTQLLVSQSIIGTRLFGDITGGSCQTRLKNHC
jgi:hypothetical protein